MKKFVLLAAAGFLMTACGNKSGNTGRNEDMGGGAVTPDGRCSQAVVDANKAVLLNTDHDGSHKSCATLKTLIGDNTCRTQNNSKSKEISISYADYKKDECASYEALAKKNQQQPLPPDDSNGGVTNSDGNLPGPSDSHPPRRRPAPSSSSSSQSRSDARDQDQTQNDNGGQQTAQLLLPRRQQPQVQQPMPSADGNEVAFEHGRRRLHVRVTNLDKLDDILASNEGPSTLAVRSEAMPRQQAMDLMSINDNVTGCYLSGNLQYLRRGQSITMDISERYLNGQYEVKMANAIGDSEGFEIHCLKLARAINLTDLQRSLRGMLEIKK